MLLAAIPWAACAGPAAAFTFVDGTTVQCIARGQVVEEKFAPAGDPAFYNRTALAARAGDGWQITWNQERLLGLPPEIRDFLFFHECAHARIPTENELEANCAGLKEMRAAGRAGAAFEARLRGYFKQDNAYWNDTFRCANEGAPAAPAPKQVG